jgi:metallo-beta-lactamase class B
MRLVFAITLLTLLPPVVFPQTAASITNPEWTKPFGPVRIIGNVYWVGTWDLSTYLITTPQGHILINTGLAQTNSQIKANIEKLGFKVSDVKILTATHGHFDHVAGMAELKRATGASLVMSEPDAQLLETGGKADFRWGNDPGAQFETVHVDRRLRDGDRIELGGVSLTAHLHPGHTKGATSFTFDVTENGKSYRVAIMNMPSINPGVKLTGMPGFPNIGEAYAQTFAKQKAMQFDVFLASHAAQFGLHSSDRHYGDYASFQASLTQLEDAYRAQLVKDRAAK